MKTTRRIRTKFQALLVVAFFAVAAFAGVATARTSTAEAVYCVKCIQGTCWQLPEDGAAQCIYDPFPPYCSGVTGFCVAFSQSQIDASSRLAS